MAKWIHIFTSICSQFHHKNNKGINNGHQTSQRGGNKDRILEVGSGLLAVTDLANKKT